MATSQFAAIVFHRRSNISCVQAEACGVMTVEGGSLWNGSPDGLGLLSPGDGYRHESNLVCVHSQPSNIT